MLLGKGTSLLIHTCGPLLHTENDNDTNCMQRGSLNIDFQLRKASTIIEIKEKSTP